MNVATAHSVFFKAQYQRLKNKPLSNNWMINMMNNPEIDVMNNRMIR